MPFDPFSSGLATLDEKQDAVQSKSFDPFASGLATEVKPSAIETPIAKDKPIPYGNFTEQDYQKDYAQKSASYYGDLNTVMDRIDGDRKTALNNLVANAPANEKNEYLARSVNQWFVSSQMPDTDPQWISQNWENAKRGFVKARLGMDVDTIADQTLYDVISRQLKEGTISPKEPFTWHMPITVFPMEKAEAEANKSFWDSLNTNIIKLGRVSKNVPDMPQLGAANPAIAAGVYNGFVAPAIESFATPLGIATMGALGPLKASAASSKLAKTALLSTEGGFTALMGYSTYENGKKLYSTANNPNATTQDVITDTGETLLSLLGTVAAPLSYAFDLLGERSSSVAKDLENKKPSAAAEVLLQEGAVAKDKATSDALNVAGDELSKLSTFENGPDTWPKSEPVTQTEFDFADGSEEARQQPLVEPPAPTKSVYDETSLKNAAGEIERLKETGETFTEAETRTMSTEWIRAGEILQKYPQAGEDLAARLKADPNMGLSDTQSALLLRHKVKLTNDLEAAQNLFNDLNQPPEVRAEALKQTQELSGKFVELLDAINKRGSEWGREGRWRQAAAKQDYSFGAQVALLQGVKGRELTVDEITDLSDKVTKLQQAENQLRTYLESKKNADPSKSFDDLIQETLNPKKESPSFKKADRLQEILRAKSEESKKYLSGKLFSASPDVLYHLGVIGAEHIYSAGLDFTKWSAEMVRDLGEKVQPYLKDVWEDAKKTYNQQHRDYVVEDLKDALKENDNVEIGNIAQQLAKGFISDGTTDRDKIVKAVKDQLSEAIPDITERETRDAISGYGKYRQLSQDELTVKLRDVKGQLLQISKLEDLAAGEQVKKTGAERRKPSAEEQVLIEKVKEAQKPKRSPQEIALDQVKTRLENEIESLERQISTKTKEAKIKRSLVLDSEAEELKEKRNELKKQYKQVFDDPDLNAQQRLNRYKSRLKATQLKYEEKLRNKDFGPTPKPEPITLDEEANKLKRNVARLRDDINIGREKARLKKRPGYVKAAEVVSGLARSAAISGIDTLGKLAGFTLGKIIETPLAEGAGFILRNIPYLKDDLFKKATSESGAEFQALGAFFAKGAIEGAKEAGAILKTGKSNLDIELGDPVANARPVKWFDFMGVVHKAEKAFIKTGDYYMRMTRIFANAAAEGKDLSNDVVQAAIRKQEFNESNRSILQENNDMANAVNKVVGDIEAKNPELDEANVSKTLLTTFIKTFVTKGIVKTPLNFLKQTYERSPLGLGEGAYRTTKAYMKGIDSLSTQEANTIARLLKVGAVGTAMFVWGAIDATKDPEKRMFGGYYTGSLKRDPKDVSAGKVKIDGFELPHWASHNLLTEEAQMGSTFVRVMLSKISKKDTEQQGFLAGAVASIWGLLDQGAPIVTPTARAAVQFSRGQYQDYVNNQVAGLTPRFLTNIAEYLDRRDGTGVKRAPKTPTQAFESTIPYLRENVPEKQEKPKRSIGERFKHGL